MADTTIHTPIKGTPAYAIPPGATWDAAANDYRDVNGNLLGNKYPVPGSSIPERRFHRDESLRYDKSGKVIGVVDKRVFHERFAGNLRRLILAFLSDPEFSGLSSRINDRGGVALRTAFKDFMREANTDVPEVDTATPLELVTKRTLKVDGNVVIENGVATFTAQEVIGELGDRTAPAANFRLAVSEVKQSDPNEPIFTLDPAADGYVASKDPKSPQFKLDPLYPWDARYALPKDDPQYLPLPKRGDPKVPVLPVNDTDLTDAQLDAVASDKPIYNEDGTVRTPTPKEVKTARDRKAALAAKKTPTRH